MNPSLSNFSQNAGILEFTLYGVDVSIANALRRTILTDIKRIVLNNAKIEVNTSAHFHNEIMKHRIQCVPLIPVHKGRLMSTEEMADFVQDNYITVDVMNDTSEPIYVTTEHFKIFNKITGEFLNTKETREKFPAYQDTYFIDLMRLAPSRGPTIPGEHFKAVIEMSTNTAKNDGCFTVVSTCAYQNTPDPNKKQTAWRQAEINERKQLEESGTDRSTIEQVVEFKRRDFELLDAQRYFVPDSFDFIIESNGIYENNDIVLRGCLTLIGRAVELIRQIDSEEVQIVDSKTRVSRGEFSTMANSVDIVIPNGDYTIGYMLNAILYAMYFEGERKLSFCGFAKFLPHHNECVSRMALHNEQDIILAKGMLKNAVVKIQELFQIIATPFSKKTTATR